MTNAEMLAKVRSLLDEASEDFYLDDEEIYPALSEAQRELVKTVADTWFYQSRQSLAPVPKAIQPLVKLDTGSILIGESSFSASTGIVVPVSSLWSPSSPLIENAKPAIFVTAGEVYHLLYNKELADGFYCWWGIETANSKVYFNPKSTSNSSLYQFSFIKDPVNITASVQPVTDSVAHDAIVERAMWILMKDREVAVAQTHLQLFGQLLQGLIK